MTDAVTSTIESLLETPAEAALEAATETANGESAAAVERPDLLELLGRKHALPILRAATTVPGPVRFSELERTIDASPSTISARLSEFVEAGLLERTTYDEVPPRVEYEPTEAAALLSPLFAYLQLWESRYGDELW